MPSATAPTASAATSPLSLIPLPSLCCPSLRGAPAPGQWRRGVSLWYGGKPRPVLGCCGWSREMQFEHRLDPRGAGTPLDPVDDAPSLDEHDGRDVGDPEALCQLGLILDVDAHHAEARALLPCEVREQALHP